MKKYISIIFPVLVLMVGCDKTVYRLLYNSLDSILYSSVTHYIVPSPGQDRFLKEKIDFHLRWHRKVELPKYIVTLQGLRDRMAEGLKKPDVAWIQARIDRHEADLYNVISDDVASFLVTLDQNQVDRLERTMGERISEIEKESRKSDEDRIREIERSTSRFMEFIYGSLSECQKNDIARMARQTENLEPERIRLFRERQAEFIAFLRKKPDKGMVQDYLTRLIINPERSYPEYYRKPAERRERHAIEAFLRFDRELITPEQRLYACKKIDTLIQVFKELTVE
jgi:hypothetical protein